MGKKFLLAITCLLICQFGQSQNDSSESEWAFGVNAGVTLSDISFNPSIPQDMLQQYVGGATARYISEKNFGIQVELNYSMRGWKQKEEEGAQPNKYTRSLSYLELPVMTHMYFNMGRRARLVFNLGPQLSYKISEKTITKEIYVVENMPPYYGVGDDMDIQRPFDWGLIGGMGVEIRTGVGSFILDGRYYFGLSDIFSNHKSDYFQASSNRVINIKLTYLFRQ